MGKRRRRRVRAEVRRAVNGAFGDSVARIAAVAPREAVARDDTALAGALERVADSCRMVAEELRAHRAERRALVDAVAHLGALTPEMSQMPKHQVIGGRVDVSGAALEEDTVARESVEVRCRFGDRWAAGFEVCEAVRSDGHVRYRLRRRSDGCVLPELFDEQDVRVHISLVDS